MTRDSLERAAVPAALLAAGLVEGLLPLPFLGTSLLLAAALAERRSSLRRVLLLATAAVLLSRDLLPRRAQPAAAPARLFLERSQHRALELQARAGEARAALDLARTGGPAAAFDAFKRLPLPPGSGVTWYRAGRPQAWAGKVTALSAPLPASGPRVIGLDPARALARIDRVGDDVLVVEQGLAELLVDLPLRARVLAEDARDAEALQRQAGDTAGTLWLADGEGRTFAILGLESVTGSPSGEPVDLADGAARLLLAGLLLALLFPAPAPARVTLASPLVALAAAAVARLLFLPPAAHHPVRLFSAAAFGLATPLRLLASPADALLSGTVAFLLAVALARRPVHRVPGRTRAAMSLALIAIAAGRLSRYSAALSGRVSLNSDLDLTDFSPWPFEPERLASLLGLMLLALAPVVLLGAFGRAALHAWTGWRRPAAAGLSALLALVLSGGTDSAGVAAGDTGTWILAALPLLAALASLPSSRPRGYRIVFLVLLAALGVERQNRDAQDAALRRLLEHELRDALLGHEPRLRERLAEVRAQLAGRLGRALSGRRPDEQAYLIWRDSALRAEGYRSAIEVQPAEGPPGRFVYRLPLPAVLPPEAPGELRHERLDFGGEPQRVLALSEFLPDGNRVTLRVAEDHEDLPFFSAAHRLRGRIQAAPDGQHGLLGRAQVRLAVSDSRGRPIDPTARDARLVPEAIAGALGEAGRWWSSHEGSDRVDHLSFRVDDRVLTLSLPRSSRAEQLAAGLEGFLLLGLVLGLGASASLLGRGRWRAGPRLLASYERKLLAAFLIVATLPILPTALYLRSSAAADKLDELTGRSLAALSLARRILSETHPPQEPAAPDDSDLIWLAESVGHDLAYYRDSTLVATSMREAFREGQMSERAPARAWREVVLAGAPVQLEFHGAGEPVALAASAPAGPGALLTLFTLTRHGELERAAAERERTLFLALAGLWLLGVLLAPVVARHATRPLAALTRAAERIGRGDLTTRIAEDRGDELGVLIAAFNRMAGELETERLELSEKTAYLARLLENAPTGVVSVDGEGTLRTANPAARSLLGSSLDPGSSAREAFHAPELSALRAAIEQPAPPEREELELRSPSAAAETLRARLVRLPSPAAGRAGRLILLEDLTGIVAKKKLEAWSEMARRVAHEVKNPLTPVQLAAEHSLRLLGDRREGFERVIRACLETILRQVGELRRTVREFSQYGSPAAALDKVPTPIPEFLSQLLAPYRVGCPPGIEFSAEFEPGCAWRIDPARLGRALINLIENALNAMPQGGTLALRSRRGAAGQLVIEVSDTGIGIPPEVRARLFEPYFSTRDGGTGLGLANARRAVEEHGGSIRLAEDVGGGSTLRIELPAADAA